MFYALEIFIRNVLYQLKIMTSKILVDHKKLQTQALDQIGSMVSSSYDNLMGDALADKYDFSQGGTLDFNTVELVGGGIGIPVLIPIPSTGAVLNAEIVAPIGTPIADASGVIIHTLSADDRPVAWNNNVNPKTPALVSWRFPISNKLNSGFFCQMPIMTIAKVTYQSWSK